ncbi:hypothetical protein EmuJ_000283600 [Echinococcus multilocularis]|uniref:Uncharacterized protein n=1 Tax=Echinococcus multilocularis TaxID=6211 RepID=A0A068XUR9_ECHMU|nr:hypothetical protein EmuJ_000283600 [Echinococcus multilocularis]
MLPPAFVNAFSLCCSVASLFIVHQSTHAMNKRAEKGETILGGIIFSWTVFIQLPHCNSWPDCHKTTR